MLHFKNNLDMLRLLCGLKSAVSTSEERIDNETLVQFKPDYNPPCAKYCIPEIEKIMQREVNNHQAIIEILDMLVEYGSAIGRAKSTNDYNLQVKACDLKERLVQSNENIS